MTHKPLENNPLLALSQEHTFILQNLAELERCADMPEPEKKFAMLKKCIENFEASLTRHNRIEELTIFRTALVVVQTEEIVDIVLKLQKEHGIIETQIEILSSDIWYASKHSLKDISKIFIRINKIINMVKQHAMTEVKELFPKLSKNPRCMAMISRIK